MDFAPPVLAFIGNIGLPEVILILVLLVVLFGAQKIPELARSLGRAKGEFQRGAEEGEKMVSAPLSEEDRVRKAARDLGLETEGRSVAELKAAIAERLK